KFVSFITIFHSMTHNEPPLCGVFERACSRRKSSKAGDGRTSCESNDGFSSSLRSGGSMEKNFN
ncbi:hypothetical protein, partial [Flavobacterium psychrophilum]|uniref:hypothetical protein n=1 Tax=Flavobacterium psychrophilum TaxID=96345 RepID=UPI00054C3E76